MAIYSLNLKSIGRSTHASGTAGAHLHYIAREGAEPELVAEHMPTDPTAARTWMDGQERADRKNARVIDKVRIALPRELTPEQRMELVKDFAEDLTQNRVPWFAAIHATGKDAANPHAHIVIRDRDIETGKRVLRLSDSPRDRAKAGLEPKAVEHVRERWEHHANRALDRAGHEARIDRRSLEAQGIDREPTIHIGPRAAHIEGSVQKPMSKPRVTGNGRVIHYPKIDQGRSRQDRQAEIVEFNLEKAARSPNFAIRERARFEREQKAKDRLLEERLIREARARTEAERRARAARDRELAALREDRRAVEKEAKGLLRADWHARRSRLTERHRLERDALAKEHGRLKASFLRRVDLTGRTRARQEADRTALQKRQEAERAGLVAGHRERRATCVQMIRGRHAALKDDVRATHRPVLVELREKQIEAERTADRQRQLRAAEREQAERRFETSLAQAERYLKQQEKAKSWHRGPGRV